MPRFRAGMLRVATIAELFDAMETLALTGEQDGDRQYGISELVGMYCARTSRCWRCAENSALR